MSRRIVDPVDRAFDFWRELTTEQKLRLADLQRGFNSAAYGGEAAPVQGRKRRAKAADSKPPSPGSGGGTGGFSSSGSGSGTGGFSSSGSGGA